MHEAQAPMHSARKFSSSVSRCWTLEAGFENSMKLEELKKKLGVQMKPMCVWYWLGQ